MPKNPISIMAGHAPIHHRAPFEIAPIPVTLAETLARMGQAVTHSRLHSHPKCLSTAQLLEQPDRVLALG